MAASFGSIAAAQPDQAGATVIQQRGTQNSSQIGSDNQSTQVYGNKNQTTTQRGRQNQANTQSGSGNTAGNTVQSGAQNQSAVGSGNQQSQQYGTGNRSSQTGRVDARNEQNRQWGDRASSGGTRDDRDRARRGNQGWHKGWENNKHRDERSGKYDGGR
jgi:hypothetical protein